MKKCLFLICLFRLSFAFGQPNCNVYKMNNDEPCYKACNLAIEAEQFQWTREGQIKFDEAIKLCPKLDYAYMEKSVPYLKSGDFIEWRRLMDKAVEINPLGRLGYRGWCRYQFIRDYKGAIADFEQLDSMTQFDIGYSQNGDYQLNIAKALCYRAIGEKNKAMEIIQKQLSEKGYSPMTYDYLHLGVLKMEIGDSKGAIEYLKKSIAYNDYLAEPYYYLALIYKKQKLSKDFKENIEKAKSYYLKGYKRFDPYTHPMDKVYLSDIERELREN
jgi:tetratricopeptide (TPR) repeat protein